MRLKMTTAAILTAMMLTAAPAKAVIIDRVVATVNGEIITLLDLYKAEVPVFGKVLVPSSAFDTLDTSDRGRERQLLDQLVEERLLLQRARDRGLTASPPEIDEAVARVQRENQLTPEMFSAVLEKRGMSLDLYRKRIESQIIISKLVGLEVRPRVVVNADEIAAYYEEHRSSYMTSGRVRIRHILVGPGASKDAARAKATEALTKLKEGRDFPEVAREYGEAAAKGEVSNWIQRGDTLPELDAVIFGLKPGQLAPIIESPAGFHIVKMEESEPESGKDLAAATPEITTLLTGQKAEVKYREWLEEIRKNATIKIRL